MTCTTRLMLTMVINLYQELSTKIAALEEIITKSYDASAIAQSGVFNNASQHWNHMQFWEMMSPGQTGLPSELASAIDDSFGSFEKFKEDFYASGVGQFGSGWVWLVRSSEGGLKFQRLKMESTLSATVKQLY